MVKDLANVKILATLLEEEHERVKKPLPPPEKKPEEPLADGAAPDDSNAAPSDTIMADAEPQDSEVEEYEESKEKGSEAVEKRIEKIMADLLDSGTIDVNDEMAVDQRRVSLTAFPLFRVRVSGAQAVSVQVAISLDLYISYLRAAFNTCFYCAVVTDHVEELQRKCVKHVRKPMTQAMIEELKAVNAVAVEVEKEVDEVDKSGGIEDGENEDQDMVQEKPKPVVKEKDSEPSGRDRGYETRDWKRNGRISLLISNQTVR